MCLAGTDLDGIGLHHLMVSVRHLDPYSGLPMKCTAHDVRVQRGHKEGDAIELQAIVL